MELIFSSNQSHHYEQSDLKGSFLLLSFSILVCKENLRALSQRAWKVTMHMKFEVEHRKAMRRQWQWHGKLIPSQVLAQSPTDGDHSSNISPTHSKRKIQLRFLFTEVHLQIGSIGEENPLWPLPNEPIAILEISNHWDSWGVKIPGIFYVSLSPVKEKDTFVQWHCTFHVFPPLGQGDSRAD